jgi:ribose transport system substrate-binding protein
MRFRAGLKCLTFAALLPLVTIAGCSGASNKTETKKVKLAFVTNTNADFWTMARKGTEAAGKELHNVDVEFQIADGTAADQRRIVDDLLTKGVSGIAISPVDPANQTQMLNEMAQKAVVITQDSDAPASNRMAYIGTDNIAAGKQAGELIRDALPNGGSIMLFVGKIDAQNAKERAEGIRQILAGTKIQILDVKTDDGDQVRAKANAADTIVKHPEVAALIGLWGYNGPAIISALKDAKKLNKIQVVCFDDDPQTIAGIMDGSVHGTIVQQPYEFGYQAIQLMDRILLGDKSDIPPTKQRFIPTLAVTKANVNDYSDRINKLQNGS